MQVNSTLNYNYLTSQVSSLPAPTPNFKEISSFYKADSASLSTTNTPVNSDPYNQERGSAISPELKMGLIIGLPTLATGTAGFFIGRAMGSALGGTLIGAAVAPAVLASAYIIMLISSGEG